MRFNSPATLWASRRYPGAASFHYYHRYLFPIFTVIALLIALVAFEPWMGWLDLCIFLAVFLIGISMSYWIARPVLLHYSLRKRNWGKAFYFFEIPHDWPVFGLTAVILQRLGRRGLGAERTDPRAIPLALRGEHERLMWSYRIAPGGRELLVLDTKEFRAIGDHVYTTDHFALVIRPIAKPFKEADDPLVDTVGAVLWDFEMVRQRKGMRSTIPGV